MQVVAEGRFKSNHKSSGGDDDGSDGEPPTSDGQRTLRAVTQFIAELDFVRINLMRLYVGQSSGTIAEFEVGESLQATRKAIQRLRKAQLELMKQPLPGME